MKLVATTITGDMRHVNIELPEGTVDLSISLIEDMGPIFGISLSDDGNTLEIREKTFRRFSVQPSSANTLELKAI